MGIHFGQIVADNQLLCPPISTSLHPPYPFPVFQLNEVMEKETYKTAIELLQRYEPNHPSLQHTPVQPAPQAHGGRGRTETRRRAQPTPHPAMLHQALTPMPPPATPAAPPPRNPLPPATPARPVEQVSTPQVSANTTTIQPFIPPGQFFSPSSTETLTPYFLSPHPGMCLGAPPGPPTPCPILPRDRSKVDKVLWPFPAHPTPTLCLHPTPTSHVPTSAHTQGPPHTSAHTQGPLSPHPRSSPHTSTHTHLSCPHPSPHPPLMSPPSPPLVSPSQPIPTSHVPIPAPTPALVSPLQPTSHVPIPAHTHLSCWFLFPPHTHLSYPVPTPTSSALAHLLCPHSSPHPPIVSPHKRWVWFLFPPHTHLSYPVPTPTSRVPSPAHTYLSCPVSPPHVSPYPQGDKRREVQSDKG
jgi:hypothetical protein